MRILVKAVSPPELLGIVTYEQGKVSFSTDAARNQFLALQNKVRSRAPLSTEKTVQIMKSWSNGYVLTEME